MRDTKTGWLARPGPGNGRFGTPACCSASPGRASPPPRWPATSPATGGPTSSAVNRTACVYLVADHRDRQRWAAAPSAQRVGTQYNALVGGARDLTGDGYGDVVVRSASTGQAVHPARQAGAHLRPDARARSTAAERAEPALAPGR